MRDSLAMVAVVAFGALAFLVFVLGEPGDTEVRRYAKYLAARVKARWKWLKGIWK